MGGRTPSFLVVGLLMITFLVGFFYMSCSTKASELQRTLNEFESRVRMLTIKNSDKERELETVLNQKRELEREKGDVRRQVEKKESELSELNTKLNERLAELRSLKSDKQVLEEQLKEYKNATDMLASRNNAIHRLQQEIDERKKSDGERLVQLQQDVDRYKIQINQSQGVLGGPNGRRYRALLPEDGQSKNTSSSLLQGPLATLSNFTNQIKEQIVPVGEFVKQQFANVVNTSQNSNVSQNLPAPPLDRDQRRPVRDESGREIDNNNPMPDNADIRGRQPRLIGDENRPTDKAQNGTSRFSRVRSNIANHLEDRAPRREESQREFFHNNDRNQVIANKRRARGGRANLL